MKELQKQFTGKGEVRGFTFNKIETSNFGYIYEVSPTFGAKWYEVFKRKINARFGSVSYPTSKGFGIWAWTCKDLANAEKKLKWIDENGNKGFS